MFLNKIQKKMSKNFLINGIETHELDARIILKEVLSFNDKDLILNQDFLISKNLINKINSFELRRIKGEPISKIFKKRDFYNSTFIISKDVLDPRPETELIIDIANDLIKNNHVKNILDLGTGSGCILLSILKEHKTIIGTGIDLSKKAVDIAIKNSRKLSLEKQSNFFISNWLDSINDTYDLIVSNPPYIPSTDIENLPMDVKNFDPILSLDGGSDGLDCYRKIAKDLKKVINKNGVIILEIGYNQAYKVIKIFELLDFILVRKYNDINGLDRVLVFEIKKNKKK